MRKITIFAIALSCCLNSCKTDEVDNKKDNNFDSSVSLFQTLNKSTSNLTFANNLKEDSIVNYFSYPYIYMGGGVAAGDVNNDGFTDLYFTGNMVENQLFLNKGKGISFENITEKAGVSSDNRWVTGVTMADVNADGWLDIYISVSGKWETTKNQLFLNKHADENGIPTFEEVAEERGLADEGHSTQTTFFDYDKDGDLDCFVANYPPTHFKTPNYAFLYAANEKLPEKSDHLYQNDGNGFFRDVTKEAGLLNFGLTLSATVGDFNNDGWDDLYLSNDFASSDYFYFNNGDGTFTEKVKEAMQHIAFFGMGADASDYNNDGLLDLLQMDMTPADNRRNKANMASMNIPGFWEMIEMGLNFQYMQNALQLNQGITPDGLPHFSDLSRMSGLATTDWSWAGLFADLDNDGWKDIFITNGTRRDINNKDYFNRIKDANYEEKQMFNDLDLTLNMPSEKVTNYTYRNNGDLSFDNVTDEWGLRYDGFSNGAAYADLDNDGDLEIIINNIDAPAMIFENLANKKAANNYLKIKFNGPEKNQFGIGTKVTLKDQNGNIQYRQHAMTRGFQSSVEEKMHFGLGSLNQIAELKVEWPDGKSQKLIDVSTNQELILNYQEAKVDNSNVETTAEKLITEVTNEVGVKFVHEENPYDDYNVEILLPHTYSRNGPGLATGDVNGDNLDDFYMGGAFGKKGALYIQQKDGSFEEPQFDFWSQQKAHEDMDALFFDADGDGDQDLYVVSGGNEVNEGSKQLEDRLYLNDGKGQFSISSSSLPNIALSGSRVKAADFDKDGDLDLFVGSRLVPQEYPRPAKSTILRNDGIQNGVLKFKDVTAEIAPMLLEAGLVTDAIWTDFDNDKQLDLIIVGEWMPITFLRNENKKFVDVSTKKGFEETTGWWYSIEQADFDGDGDMDIVAGNLGLNYKYQADKETSFDVYANDFDNNGKLDIVLGYYNDGEQYPVRGRQCSSQQIPTIKYKYEDYNTFASATLEDIYTEKDLEASLHYQARTFASVFLENKGNGDFDIRQLPNEVQISSINNIIPHDFNNDGFLDMMLTGNLFGSEIETTRNDASFGQVLIGDGTCNFKSIPYAESGLMLGGDIKDAALLRTKDGEMILIGNNSGPLQFLKTLNPLPE